MSVTLKESAMQVETVDDVIRWTNKNLVSIGKHMNWLEDTSKESFKACRDDFDKMAKRVKKLERRSRLNWLVTAAGFAVVGYFLKNIKDKVDDEFFDTSDIDIENKIDDLENRVMDAQLREDKRIDKQEELENRVDFLVDRVNDLENKNIKEK